MRKFVNAIIILLLSISLFPGEINLKLVKTIGDERENYTFFNIYSAVESDTGDFFIADGRGHFIAKYDRQGNFKKKIGQKGQGPGDFYYPGSLNIYNKKLFVYDTMNYRIVEMDMNLNFLAISKPKFNMERRFNDNFFIIDDNRFLGDLSFLKNVVGNVSIIDRSGSKAQVIFDGFPVESRKKFSGINITKSYVLSMGLSRKSIAVDRENKRVLISFKRPDNPIEFFVYDFDGKLKMKFSHSLEKKYKFPYYTLYSQKEPNHSYEFGIGSVFIYKKNYIAALVQFERKKTKSSKQVDTLLVFSENGKLRHQEIFNESYRFFYISKKGHLLGKNFDADIEQLYVFRLGI
ncbi:MAG: hypothetical protein KAT34_13195 [Candidatus Aminicenantes bacterium]|nr:hypothetical protein [Candidatus Aminicenantes bacterium]